MSLVSILSDVAAALKIAAELHPSPDMARLANSVQTGVDTMKAEDGTPELEQAPFITDDTLQRSMA